MQLQLRQNAEDLHDYLRDLETWESEIKKKDDSLRRQKPILKEVILSTTTQHACMLVGHTDNLLPVFAFTNLMSLGFYV